jgi:NH3-dependent NAD+ synthetase
MKSLKHYVDLMKNLLEELVQNAQKLKDLSQRVISEEELSPLQEHQQKLLQELEKVDSYLQQHHPNQMDKNEHKLFHEQLHQFHRLNQEFIQNLNASHGLIQFELRHLKGNASEESMDDIPSLPRRNITKK